MDDFITNERRAALAEWTKARIANIHDHIHAGDVLIRHGVSLRWNGDREEQISCPFHGKDENPSARYYPTESDSRSHVWCYACHKRWDAIGLWIEFNGKKDRFSQTLFQIEKSFGLTPPEIKLPESLEDEYDPVAEEVRYLIDLFENRLRDERESFEMTSHLKLGAILDNLLFAVERGSISLEEAKTRLLQVLEKIGDKVRASKVVNP